MSNKKLTVLGITAVVMVGWAILQNRISSNSKTPDLSSSTLIEGLQIDSVMEISITGGKNEEAVSLRRAGQRFVVANKGNYLADVTKINDLISSCLDIRIREKVTDNPDNHADLGLTDETARYRVVFLDDESEEIVGLVVSDSDEKGNAFARLLSSDQAYSIQSPPWISTSPMDYIDTDLFDIEQKQIASVSVRTNQDDYVLKASEDKTSVGLQDMPEGKQYKGTAYKSVFSALASLRFEDVVNAADVPESLVFESTYTCRLDDKTVYKLSLAKKDQKTYAKVSADYLDKSQVQVSQEDSEEQLKEKEAKLLAIDAVKVFNQNHQKWLYQLPSYQAENLTKPLSELLEDIPEPGSEAQSESTE